MTDLLLVGAGHAHLRVVRDAAVLADAGYRVRLLAPRWFHYSGVASATAAGAVPPGAGRIDVAALTERSGVAFDEGTLASLDHAGRRAFTDGGAELPYDVASLNIGSVAAPRGIDVGGDVLRVKPLDGLAALRDRLALASGTGTRVTVAGAGHSGVELAAHLAVHPRVASVRLVEAGPRLGPDLPPGARSRLARLLARRGVEVLLTSPVGRLDGSAVALADGSIREHDLAILATGLAAPPLVSALGLGGDDGIPVRATLQHRDHDDLYAVGDCAHFLPRPLPWIGVHGVRQGPVLLRSLLARAAGDPLPIYDPQCRALAVLDLGGGTGLAVRGRWWWQGRAALRLKRRIDDRWLAGYRAG